MTGQPPAISAQPHSVAGGTDKDTWNSLRGDNNPFVDWQFLTLLEQHGATGPGTAWQPCPLDGSKGQQLACAPAYLKHDSWGEFVFDWAWADAHERSLGPYYPKLLVAAPLTPVTGPRLLADSPEQRQSLLNALWQQTVETQLSGAHINFPGTTDAEAIREHGGWLERFDWQFHWFNRDYADFDAFLAALTRTRRKKIRQERRRVAKAGWSFAAVSGDEATESQIDLAVRCYQSTFIAKNNLPCLSRDFFADLCARMGQQVLFIIASKEDRELACAIFLRDDNRLYGRYWGSLVDASMLHFETCYYQAIEFAIAQGIAAVEPGAQGEHKFMRGFVPVRTHSFHRFTDPRFHDAIARFLDAEARRLDQYYDALQSHWPYQEGP